MKLITALMVLVIGMPTVAAPEIAKVSALSSGKLLLNGVSTDLVALEAEFQMLQANRGAVWYFREGADEDPTPEATSVMKLIVKYQLPVSLSTKADFSDYVDADGRSRPRTP